MSPPRSEPKLPSRAQYRAELLVSPSCGPEGISHGPAEHRQLLAWNQIQQAHVAEVGEPEGVRTIVFDLVVRRDAEGWRVLRFDADPGEAAMGVARQLGQALGPERASPSIKSVATDGIASRWYPDLEALELDAIRGGIG